MDYVFDGVVIPVNDSNSEITGLTKYLRRGMPKSVTEQLKETQNMALNSNSNHLILLLLTLDSEGMRSQEKNFPKTQKYDQGK